MISSLARAAGVICLAVSAARATGGRVGVFPLHDGDGGGIVGTAFLVDDDDHIFLSAAHVLAALGEGASPHLRWEFLGYELDIPLRVLYTPANLDELRSAGSPASDRRPEDWAVLTLANAEKGRYLAPFHAIDSSHEMSYRDVGNRLKSSQEVTVYGFAGDASADRLDLGIPGSFTRTPTEDDAFFRIKLEVQPGYSGAPCVFADGALAGVTIAFDETNLGSCYVRPYYAIARPMARALADLTGFVKLRQAILEGGAAVDILLVVEQMSSIEHWQFIDYLCSGDSGLDATDLAGWLYRFYSYNLAVSEQGILRDCLPAVHTALAPLAAQAPDSRFALDYTTSVLEGLPSINVGEYDGESIARLAMSYALADNDSLAGNSGAAFQLALQANPAQALASLSENASAGGEGVRLAEFVYAFSDHFDAQYTMAAEQEIAVLQSQLAEVHEVNAQVKRRLAQQEDQLAELREHLAGLREHLATQEHLVARAQAERDAALKSSVHVLLEIGGDLSEDGWKKASQRYVASFAREDAGLAKDEWSVLLREVAEELRRKELLDSRTRARLEQLREQFDSRVWRDP